MMADVIGRGGAGGGGGPTSSGAVASGNTGGGAWAGAGSTNADAAATRRRITEALDVDVTTRRWHCNRCGLELGDAARDYKEFCLLYDRDPREIHVPFREPTPFSFTPDPEWCRIVEVYCPGCGVMFDAEYLPPGHPPTRDIELDLDRLR
jgi:acetophenone carboxylase